MKRSLINFIAFQLGWFACVLSAAKGMPWVGVLFAALVISLHLYLAERPGQEFRLILLALFMGLVVDSLLVNSGWLQYAGGPTIAGFAPYWILAMWALFATTLNISMSWLKGWPTPAVLLGMVFGPLSYMAGQRLGALEFINFYPAIATLMVVWALAMPLLVSAASRFDGIRKPQSASPLQGLSNG